MPMTRRPIWCCSITPLSCQKIAAAKIINRQQYAFKVVPPDRRSNVEQGLADRSCEQQKHRYLIIVLHSVAVVAPHTLRLEFGVVERSSSRLSMRLRR